MERNYRKFCIVNVLHAWEILQAIAGGNKCCFRREILQVTAWKENTASKPKGGTLIRQGALKGAS